MFTDKEIEYLQSQRLARVATVSSDGQPDVTPVGYEFDGRHIFIGGHNATKTRKFKNVQAGNEKVALVVDDFISLNPWQPRGMRIYGIAKVVGRAGWLGESIYLRIKPVISWSWNIESVSDSSGNQSFHKVEHNFAEEKS
jgi:pyridoxamine 5'-phosphate oxidase family protein